MKKESFMSLYDYLGRAAGSTLGAAVHTRAKIDNEPTSIREVSNPKYTGKIVLYRREFLDKYFNKQTDTTLPFQENDGLIF